MVFKGKKRQRGGVRRRQRGGSKLETSKKVIQEIIRATKHIKQLQKGGRWPTRSDIF